MSNYFNMRSGSFEDYLMRHLSVSRKAFTILMFVLFLFITSVTARAGSDDRWVHDKKGTKYIFTDNDGNSTGQATGWEWLPTENPDDRPETVRCYYFGQDGYLFKSGSITPDGCTINSLGEWVEGGSPVTAYEILIMGPFTAGTRDTVTLGREFEDSGKELYIDASTKFAHPEDMPSVLPGETPLKWMRRWIGTDMNTIEIKGIYRVMLTGNHVDTILGVYAWD